MKDTVITKYLVWPIFGPRQTKVLQFSLVLTLALVLSLSLALVLSLSLALVLSLSLGAEGYQCELLQLDVNDLSLQDLNFTYVWKIQYRWDYDFKSLQDLNFTRWLNLIREPRQLDVNDLESLPDHRWLDFYDIENLSYHRWLDVDDLESLDVDDLKFQWPESFSDYCLNSGSVIRYFNSFRISETVQTVFSFFKYVFLNNVSCRLQWYNKFSNFRGSAFLFQMFKARTLYFLS